MLITKSEFLEELNNPEKRKHNLLFIGMSGSGKTHWSKLLAKKFNYSRFELDILIGKSEEFKNLIKEYPGKNETEKCGNYFGKPWEKEFDEKEKKYLKTEKKLMSKEYSPGSILDLTGSAIYHPQELMNMTKTGFVICLESSEKSREEMFKTYIKDPKPVCWNGLFNIQENEKNEQALKRCYKELLIYREKLYETYSDIRVPYEIHKTIKSPEEFIEEVCKVLE